MNVFKFLFPISRDPPEGGTFCRLTPIWVSLIQFPISRDPPEGGTRESGRYPGYRHSVRFQFLGIPPKGELHVFLNLAWF